MPATMLPSPFAMLPSACYHVTKYLLTCYRVLVAMLPSPCCHVTKCLLPCYQVFVVMLPSPCCHVIKSLLPCYQVPVTMLPSPFCHVTKSLLPCYQLPVAEFQSYISLNKPDIIILNESWLKDSVLDSEIINLEAYKVFRLDRSPKNHPPDPYNPKKFRKYGGGYYSL